MYTRFGAVILASIFAAAAAHAQTCTYASPGSCVQTDYGVQSPTPTLGSTGGNAGSLTIYNSTSGTFYVDTASNVSGNSFRINGTTVVGSNQAITASTNSATPLSLASTNGGAVSFQFRNVPGAGLVNDATALPMYFATANGTAYQGASLTATQTANTNGAGSTKLQLYTTSSGSVVAAMTINPAGGVSIGTSTDPGAGNLVVNGTATAGTLASSTLTVSGAASAANVYVGNTTNYGAQFNVEKAFSGTVPASSLYYTPLSGAVILTDNATVSPQGAYAQNIPVGFYIQHQFGGANVMNGRYGLLMTFQQTAASGSGNLFPYYVGISSAASSLANDNGTAITPKGNLEGMTSGAMLYPGATYYNTVIGFEVGAAISSGASAYTRAAILTDTGASGGGVAGSYADAHILSWAAVAGGGGFTDWARIDSYAGAAPITGTVIHAVGSWPIVNGVDFNSLTISGNALQWGGGAYYLSGGGAAALSNLTVTGTGYPTIQTNTVGPLSVISTAGGAMQVLHKNAPVAGSNSDSVADTYYLSTANGTPYEGAAIMAAQTSNTNGAGSTALQLYTANAGSFAKRVTINPAGGVSIGTSTDPGAGNLVVNGTATAATFTGGNLGITSTGYPFISTNTVGPLSVISTAGGAVTVPFENTPAAGALYDSENIALYFATANGTAYQGALMAGVQMSNTNGAGSVELIWDTANAGVLAQRMQLSAAGGLSLGTSTDPGAGNLLINGKITGGTASLSGVGLSLTNSVGTCTFTATASGSSTQSCSSDARLKSDIRDAASAIDWLRSFRLRDYTVRASHEPGMGVIAQEVQKTHPEMVTKTDSGMLAVQQPSPWRMMKVLQELVAENARLSARLDELEHAHR
jgi:Chaperone of endosialidase